MKNNLILIVILFLLTGCTTPASENIAVKEPAKPTIVQTNESIDQTASIENTIVKKTEPIADSERRITKKMFGTKVSPGNSPVQPEKFSGFHTGVDFETTEAEKDLDIKIMAICDGPILQRRTATGYGGIMVQECLIDEQNVTVVYGHLKLESIKAKVGDVLKASDEFAVLGKGFSSETDDERKHLHLGIHKGKTVNILGYVNDEAKLSEWIDFESLNK